MSRLLVYDHGHNIDLCRVMGRELHGVSYFTPPSDKYWETVAGSGYAKDNVEKVDSFWNIVDHVDQIILFGNSSHFDGEIVDYLRSKGKKVWGAGKQVEKLEKDRWHFAQRCEKGHLPTVRTQYVQGVESLLTILYREKNKVVKVSRFRDIETFVHDNWATTLEQHIGQLVTKYGNDPHIEFIVQDKIGGDGVVEVGSDDIVCNGKPNGIRPYGYEEKDAAYIGRIDSRVLPKVLDRTFEGLRAFGNGESSFFSVEVRGEYPTDVTARTPYPVTPALTVGFSNIFDVITQQKGVLQPLARYVGSLVLKSVWSKEYPLKVEYPSNITTFVKLLNSYKHNNVEWVAPGHDEIIGYVAAVAPTLQQLCKHLVDLAKRVKAKELFWDKTALEKLVEETIPRGRQQGVEF